MNMYIRQKLHREDQHHNRRLQNIWMSMEYIKVIQLLTKEIELLNEGINHNISMEQRKNNRRRYKVSFIARL
jgi:hypothetical protein